MLKYSPALKAILNQTKTKVEWSQKLNEALGATRRVRCFRDGNPGATDPATTGVEFLNIGNTGTIVMQGGNITSLGEVSGATIQNGADLTTGLCVMRIEGNGQWVEGTLGLESVNLDTDPTNNVDFTMSLAPSNRCGYMLGAGMRAPRLLPSGTGPEAPDLDPTRVAFMELHSYENEDAPVVVKTVAVSVRQDDLIMEDAEIAASMGDVRVTTCSETIVFGTGHRAFEFSGMLLSMNKSCNAIDPTKPVHQFLVSCKPHGRWATYPMLDTYNRFDIFGYKKTSAAGGLFLFPRVYQPLARLEKLTFTCVGLADETKKAGTHRWTVVSDNFGPMPDYFSGYNYRSLAPDTVAYSFTLEASNYAVGDTFTFDVRMTYDQTKGVDSTVPLPFKIVLKTVDGQILHTYQMHDGLPINSKFLSQKRTATQPMRLVWNCGMMLPWESHRPKMNAKAYKFWPKLVDSYIRPSMVQLGHSTNGVFPIINGGDQMNSYNHYYGMPRRNMSKDISPASDLNDPNNNPYTYDTHIYQSWARVNGWDYEPGSISGHDWYTGPGGVRWDRQAISGPLALYMQNPTGTRLRDGSSLQDNIDAWGKAYFNHSCHYMQDMLTFEAQPDAKTVYGGTVYGDNYYGSSRDYISGGTSTHAVLLAVPNKGSEAEVDYEGYPVWNAWAMDNLHAYASPGWHAVLLNSPMYVVASKHRFIATMMCQLLGASTKTTSGYLERNGAWRWLAWLQAWKLGTTSNLGISRAMIEDRWRMDMENIHRIYVVPATDPNHPEYNSPNNRQMRALGQATSESYSEIKDMPGFQATAVNSGALAFYMSVVFMMMKTTGAWDAMYNKNQKCKETLEFTMSMFDKFSIEFAVMANGRAEGGYPKTTKPTPLVDANGNKIDLSANPDLVIVARDWAEWAEFYPAKGQEDWARDPDGSLSKEKDAGQHNRASWTFMRKDYFPEFPHPMLDEAVAKYQGWYDLYTAAVDSVTKPWDKSVRDWSFLFPGMGRPRAPWVA